LNDIKHLLANLHGKQTAYLTGNATVGIAAALNAAGIYDQLVAIPNNVCINVPMAVLFSGNKPFYLDITEEDFGIDPQQLGQHIEKVAAVIAVHAYGIPCQIEKIQKICSRQGSFLIEDFCVAQGAQVNGKSVGCFGDVSVVSFGAGKIIDCGHGGAVLSDETQLLDRISEYLNKFPNTYEKGKRHLRDFARYHTDLYNQHYCGNINNFSAEFYRRAMSVKQYYYYPFNTQRSEYIFQALLNIEENIKQRTENQKWFQRFFLEHKLPYINCLKISSGSVPWRFNLFINKRRDELLSHLLKKNFKISSWQPSADLFFTNRNTTHIKTHVSDKVGDTILNLWVNHEIGKEYMKQIADEIYQFMLTS